MEAMIWKSEENSSCTRRRLNLSPAGSDVPVKCVKRRRREPSTVAGAGAEIARDQVQVDQSGGTTTTTTKRSSKFRGVSRHRWTGRFEAHLWDKGSWNVTQKKKGKQVYLGAYDEEEAAARAYDLAALKYWGPTTFTNFPVIDYEKELEIMQNVTREEYLASLRRKSSGFSRGVSKYRGVARHHHNGRWEARIGRVFGNKYLYLGTYSTQEEAAAAYDIAAIEYRGINAVTNFDLSTYIRWLRPGANNLVSPQEQQSISQNGSLASIINIGQHKESDPYLNQISLPNFMLDDLISSNYMKQELGSTNNKLGQMPSNNSLRRSSSSPALSLLFRSSVFRELLEKNPNASECETDQEDDKLQLRQHMENSRADEEFQGMFYDGIADHFPFLCGGNGGEDVVPGLDLEDRDGGKQCFDRPSQSVWSSILNMSSIQ